VVVDIMVPMASILGVRTWILEKCRKRISDILVMLGALQ